MSTFVLKIGNVDVTFTGFSKEDVSGFFEAQRTKSDCWAACLSNAFIAAGTFVARDTLVSRFGMEGWTNGPQPHEFEEMLQIVCQDFVRKRNHYRTVDGGITGIDGGVVYSVLKLSRPVIQSVNHNAHVVVLLAAGMCGNEPAVFYFEPTGGTYYAKTQQEFVARYGIGGDAYVVLTGQDPPTAPEGQSDFDDHMRAHFGTNAAAAKQVLQRNRFNS